MKKTKILSMQVVHFIDPKEQRPILILYALTRDGIYEFTNNKWKRVPPITTDT